MQRTFITDRPEELSPNQVVVDLPRYEIPLARAFVRRDIQRSGKFEDDNASLMNPPTTLNNIKLFVDELALLDKDLDPTTRIPFSNYTGLQFAKVKDAVAWARKFVQRYFPATEERLLKRALLTIPLDRTEIVWIGGDGYLGFVQAVATAPSSDELVMANAPAASSVPQLTREEASRKRAEIAARQLAKKNGIKVPEALTASTEQ